MKQREGCPSGKHRYPSQYHAECKLEAIQHNPGQVNHTPQRAYLCNLCWKWHLTAQEMRTERRTA